MKKWAIITGAGTGIGEGLALNLASKGYQVLAVGRRQGPLEKVKSKNPAQIITLSADIATDEGVDLIDKTIPGVVSTRFFHFFVMISYVRITRFAISKL